MCRTDYVVTSRSLITLPESVQPVINLIEKGGEIISSVADSDGRIHYVIKSPIIYEQKNNRK